MKTNLFIILCMFLTQSCLKNLDEKESPTILDLKYVDYYTKKGIPNLKVIFSNYRFSVSTFGSPINILDTFETDSNGKISYSFQNTENFIYELRLIIDDKHYQSGNISIKTGELNNQTVKVKSLNKSKFNLFNVTQKYSTFEITVLKTGSSISGNSNDTSVVLSTVPDDTTRVYINLENNKLNIFHHIDTLLFIPNVDTAGFTIKLYDYPLLYLKIRLSKLYC